MQSRHSPLLSERTSMDFNGAVAYLHGLYDLEILVRHATTLPTASQSSSPLTPLVVQRRKYAVT